MYLIKSKVNLNTIKLFKINLKKNQQKNTTSIVFLKSPKHFNVGKQKIKFTNKAISMTYKFKNTKLNIRNIHLSETFFKIMQKFNKNNMLITKSIKINIVGSIKFIKNC